ncbi:MAG: transcription termination/antitermination protein NusG [Synergistaceae bacterium]
MSEIFGLSNERRWYIVQTYSGYENRVRANIEQRIATMDMENRIFHVLVPIEEKVSIKDGKSKKIRRKVFPSYVLVETMLDEQSWYVIRHTPGVTGFVGSGNHPIPLTPKEVEDIMSKIGQQTKPKMEIDFAIGDVIQVTSGPFAGYTGPVTEIEVEKGKIKFLVNVFGREITAEASYEDLTKIQ